LVRRQKLSGWPDAENERGETARGHTPTAPSCRGEDEFFFVLEGKAEFFLDGKTKVAGPYTGFYCPSNVEHGIRNAGDTILKYLVIKKYEQK
jgi:mannose-6-phosphate isomerase-like protein (cupin superfamily)